MTAGSEATADRAGREIVLHAQGGKSEGLDILRLVLRQRKGSARRPLDFASVSLALRRDRAPATCTLLARRLPIEGFMHWGYCPRPDMDRGFEVASFYVPARDRDPPLEWEAGAPATGQLCLVPHPAHVPPGFAQNPRQRQVRLALCLERRGIPAPFGFEGNLFAEALPGSGLAEFRSVVRSAYDDSFARDRESALYMALEILDRDQGKAQPDARR